MQLKKKAIKILNSKRNIFATSRRMSEYGLATIWTIDNSFALRQSVSERWLCTAAPIQHHTLNVYLRFKYRRRHKMRECIL